MIYSKNIFLNLTSKSEEIVPYLAQICPFPVPSELVKYSAPNTPFVIAGLKTDLRSKAMVTGSDASHFVTYTDGKAKAAELGAAHYIECTAQNNYAGVKAIFDKAAQSATLNSLPNDMKRGSCVMS